MARGRHPRRRPASAGTIPRIGLPPAGALPTSGGAYACLKTTTADGDRLLVVADFRDTPQTVAVDLSAVETSRLADISTGETLEIGAGRRSSIPLPPFGCRFLHVL